MINLPRDYYHCFLGNGLDAVLIGYTGSMVSDRVGVDRCYWYKSDHYYPEDRLVQVAGRWPSDRPLEHAAGSGWYEIAPLGRTWYEVLWQGELLGVKASKQRFVPQEGSLYSEVDYGAVRVRVTTFVHAFRSLLVERYEFDGAIEFRAWMGPGVWVEEGWDTDPFRSVRMAEGAAQGRYDLGETQGSLALRLDVEPEDLLAEGRDRALVARGDKFTKFFSILDDRQGALEDQSYAALRREHLAFWRNYSAVSSLKIPDRQFQRFYDAGLYHFKAMQNPASGGLPVNNLRRTWSSHIFWDSYFIQRALLEANHRREALEMCRFFQRTLDQARRHAGREFGCEGLKWDWEITHDGRKAYGALLHMKDQVHNSASYANEIWGYYEFTQDLEMLRDFYPILEGLARYFLCDVIEKNANGYGTRPVVGVHESPIRVRNEGITLAGSIAILRHVDRAARRLGIESEFSRECREVAEGLARTQAGLFNGRYFASAEGSDSINMSSLAPIYPMEVFGYNDEESLQTARSFLEHYLSGVAGLPAGDERSRGPNGFPWSAGILATVFARQGQGTLAWEILESTRPAICTFGGMTEVLQDGEWNMQYFGTAQAAVCTAIHNLLLQSKDEHILVFPAVPGAWEKCSFDRLCAAGWELTGRFDRSAGRLDGTARNLSGVQLRRTLHVAGDAETIQLDPGESYAFSRQLQNDA